MLYLSSRIRTGPGYGITLGEALVSEGLSDHFVGQAFPKTPPLPWDHRKMTARQEGGLWKRAKPDLAIPGAYDHPLWFFGAGGKNALPRWSGFTLAYRIVRPYLASGRMPSKAVATPAEIVYKPYLKAHRTMGRPRGVYSTLSSGVGRDGQSPAPRSRDDREASRPSSARMIRLCRLSSGPASATPNEIECSGLSTRSTAAILSNLARASSRAHIGHGADKLVTAVTHHHVVGTQMRADDLADQRQQLVTRQMTMVVVDSLETVDVDEHEHEPCPRAVRAGELARHLFQAEPPRPCPRQLVGSGQLEAGCRLVPQLLRFRSRAFCLFAVGGRFDPVTRRLLPIGRCVGSRPLGPLQRAFDAVVCLVVGILHS